MNFSQIGLTLILILASYLIGSFPSGYLAGKFLKNIDLRELGSGSTGATNVLRHVGKKAAIGVFIVDVSKGIAPIVVAKAFSLNETLQVTLGILALTGHIWPLWLQGKGGKAVATGLGVFLGLSWQVGLSCLGVFLTIVSFTKIVSLASVSAAISLPILMSASYQGSKVPNAYLALSLISMALVIWRHRTNIRRLIKGEEPSIGNRK